MFKRSSIVVSYATDDDRVSHDLTICNNVRFCMGNETDEENLCQLKD